MAGQFSGTHHDAVEATSLYWHFVDVVWILLFSLLYLLPGKTPAARSRPHAPPSPSAQRRPSSGILFIVIGIVYCAVPDVGGVASSTRAGTTMLLSLGVAMALMAYVLVAGSPSE